MTWWEQALQVVIAALVILPSVLYTHRRFRREHQLAAATAAAEARRRHARAAELEAFDALRPADLALLEANLRLAGTDLVRAYPERADVLQPPRHPLRSAVIEVIGLRSTPALHKSPAPADPPRQTGEPCRCTQHPITGCPDLQQPAAGSRNPTRNEDHDHA